MALSMVAMVNSIQEAPLQGLGKASIPYVGLTLLFMLCTLGWLASAGSFLNSIVRPGLRPGTALFRFALIYPLIYLGAFLVIFPPSPAVLLVILPLHLLAIFCLFYTLNFVSKNLVLVERGKEITFYDYAGPFFLLWFLPIGLMIVQPRINRLYAEAKNPAE